MQNRVSQQFKEEILRKMIYFMSMTRLKSGIETMSRDENRARILAVTRPQCWYYTIKT